LKWVDKDVFETGDCVAEHFELEQISQTQLWQDLLECGEVQNEIDVLLLSSFEFLQQPAQLNWTYTCN
jgi:hypothetical protein